MNREALIFAAAFLLLGCPQETTLGDGGASDAGPADKIPDRSVDAGSFADRTAVYDTDHTSVDAAGVDSALPDSAGVDSTSLDSMSLDTRQQDDGSAVTEDAGHHSTTEIENLPAAHWLTLEGTEFSESDAFIDFGGSSSIFAYSEGVFDPTRNRLAIWGGGHADSSDNGIYAFNLDVDGDHNDYRWIEVQARSSSEHRSECYHCQYDCSGGYLRDGAPVANHTQTFLEYHPGWDAMISPMQGAISSTGSCYNDALHHNFNRYDFSPGQWVTDMADLQGAGTYFGTVVVDGFNNVWYFQTGSQPQYKVYQYKYNLDSWLVRADDSGAYGWEVFSAIDTDRNLAVVTGKGHFGVWDLSDESSPVVLSTAFTGPDDVVQARAAGLVWDPTTGLFVAWVGNETAEGDVYVLSVDPDNQSYHFMRVKQLPIDSAQLPTRTVSRGPLGRWAYSPRQNVFMLAYFHNLPIYIYKLSQATVDSDLPEIALTVAATSTSLEIPISDLRASDATSAIIGYQITTTPQAPEKWSEDWGLAPASFTVSAAGTWQIYAWAMDAFGNVSAADVASVEVVP